MRAIPIPRHHRFHIGKVEIDQAGNNNQIRNALNGLAQNIVGNAEGVEKAGAALEGGEQAFVRDGDYGVDAFFQIGKSAFSLQPDVSCLRRRTAL